MTSGRYDVVIQQGATFRREIAWRDPDGALLDLSGYTARMAVRAVKGEGLSIVDLTTENGRITLFDDSGDYNILLEMAAATSLPAWGRAYYDLELVSGSVVTRLLEGYALLSEEVTT